MKALANSPNGRELSGADDNHQKVAPLLTHDTSENNLMSTNQTARALDAPKEPMTDTATLKVDVPLSLRRIVKARATIDGTSMGDTVTQLLQAALVTPPNDEQVLGGLFKRYLPHALYIELDQARTAARSSWTQLPQMLAARFLVREPAPAPKLGPVVPRPLGATSRPATRVTESGIPGVTVTEHVDEGWDTEGESGIRSKKSASS